MLLVEDQSIIALATSARLSREGYTVKTARSGEHAVELVEESAKSGDPFALVLMDIDLGAGIDGVEAAQRILERCELPIVFLTGHAEPEYVDRVREVTRYGYVLKSSGDLMLRLTMETAVDLFEATRLTREQHRELETIYDHAPVMMLVVDRDANVTTANRRARTRACLSADEAASTTLGRVVECIRAATDPDACGRYPECERCGLRALVTETLESGAEFDDVPVTIEAGTPEESGRLRLSVSSAPLEKNGERCALVSAIDLDELPHSGENARS
ncbi:MAG: response regulator [Spirochaetota bacterium]